MGVVLVGTKCSLVKAPSCQRKDDKIKVPGMVRSLMTETESRVKILGGIGGVYPLMGASPMWQKASRFNIIHRVAKIVSSLGTCSSMLGLSIFGDERNMSPSSID